ncbi:glutaminyl-peptide cyclotransferase [Mycolicibacterium sp. BiH015]|uniref:glutaminyl-peptide cyclotransferase n=1 Tax=Mycolicibacterium sp. BiH015 TaxID=3018808 RepID=UPI0022DEB834|nr:glutaminyl-peptide cyclotransferase [Mycolicibacterium sp. BiH015]MDA2894043.1 glutaminyl-peptide cyclotransferase [Mycolicibacterium sp. BiH015]
MTPSSHRAALRVCAALALVVVAGCSASPPVAQAGPAPVIEPEILAEIPHDPAAFTQGFEINGSVLYEGTGLAGESQLRQLDPAAGTVTRAVDIPADYFGEGITLVGDRIWQLTYQDGVAVEWDKTTMAPVREVPLSGEGWGLCYDGQRLIRSDGTSRLTFHDPADFSEIGGVDVSNDGGQLKGLNELECVDGQVWANVWPTDNIARIDPASGAVTLLVNAGALRERGIPPTAQVLNGIAHVQGDEFLLTGKFWPTTFRVRLGG